MAALRFLGFGAATALVFFGGGGVGGTNSSRDTSSLLEYSESDLKYKYNFILGNIINFILTLELEAYKL